RRRSRKILDVVRDVARDRLQHLEPFLAGLDLMNPEECLEHVGRARDEGRVRLDRAVARDPIEWITPAIFREARRTPLLQLAQKMNRALQILFFPSRLVHEGETHRVVGVGDWKSCRMMKKPSR